MQIGNDIVEIDRFSKLAFNSVFLNKYFNDEEIKHINKSINPEQTLAGMFALKEAFLKCVGLGIGGGLNLKDISIFYTNDKPNILLTEKIELFLKPNYSKISCSISHTKNMASSVCIIF